MIFRGDLSDASLLLHAVATASRPVFSPAEVESAREVPLAQQGQDFLSIALAVAQSVQSGSPPTMDQLFLINLRLLENDTNAIAGEVVAPGADWLERSWRDALDQQSVRLRTPHLARRSVETALARVCPARSRYAELLLEIEPQLSFRLSPELRGFLNRLVENS
jgi:hypothetical protein